MIRVSKQVKAGKVLIGGDAPVSIQSMLSRPAADVEGNIRQALRFGKGRMRDCSGGDSGYGCGASGGCH